MVSIPALMDGSRAYRVALAGSTFLPRQDLLVNARNHRLSISDHRLGTNNHCLGAHNHCFGIRNRRISIDCQLGLKETC